MPTGTGPMGGGSDVAASSTPAYVQACRLVPEMTSGPYHLDGMAVRRDIAEDRAGFPLEMTFTVIDSQTCAPLEGAAVDIWCCDANGEYAGWNGDTLEETFHNGRNDKTYLRGIQITDTDGKATFDDELSDELMTLGEYAKHTGTRTRNDEDSIYLDGGADQLVTVDPSDPQHPTAGSTGSVTLAVDPEAVPEPLPVA